MNIDLTDALLVALAGAVTELIKRGHFLPNRYLPLVSLATGVLFALLFWLASFYPATRQLIEALTLGVLAGLTASGFYDVLHQPRRSPPHVNP